MIIGKSNPIPASAMIDYFSPAPTVEEETLRSIKGNYRRDLIRGGIKGEGLDSVPDAWKEHEISEVLKGFLQGRHPQARGGEDLPDLEEGEVEIARMSLLDSVHGEVTSLRARHGRKRGQILFRMVDEYDNGIELPEDNADGPLTAEQVVAMFRDAEPSQTETGCQVGFQSFFYPNLDDVAKAMGVK